MHDTCTNKNRNGFPKQKVNKLNTGQRGEIVDSHHACLLHARVLVTPFRSGREENIQRYMLFEMESYIRFYCVALF